MSYKSLEYLAGMCLQQITKSLKYHIFNSKQWFILFLISDQIFHIVVEYSGLENKTLTFGKYNSAYLTQDNTEAKR